MNDQKNFKDAMVLMASIFKFDLEEIHMKTYWRLFESITDEQFSTAVDAWLLKGKFFPRPSEILDMLSTSAKSSSEAWALVMKGLRDSQNANFPPEILAAVNEIGGIEALARMTFQQLEFKGREFKSAYSPDRLGELRERLDRDPKFKTMGELIGNDL